MVTAVRCHTKAQHTQNSNVQQEDKKSDHQDRRQEDRSRGVGKVPSFVFLEILCALSKNEDRSTWEPKQTKNLEGLAAVCLRLS